MKRIFSAQYPLEAHEFRLFLESHGIGAKVFDDNSALITGFAFTPASEPGVFVEDADVGRATELLRQYLERSRGSAQKRTWTCSQCGTQIESQFDACWKCETPRDETPLDLVPTESATSVTGAPEADEQASSQLSSQDSVDQPSTSGQPTNSQLWLEIAVVLSVAWLPYMASILTRSISGLGPNEIPFVAEVIGRILRNITVDAVVLYVIYRSELSWADFGIKKPRLSDTWIGILTLLLAMAVHITTYLYAASIFDGRSVYGFVHTNYKFHGPQSWTDFAWMVVMCVSNGFCEELAMRSYLITRLETLLGSSSKAVAVSSVAFASYHIYQGLGAAIWIYFGGIVFGTVFWKTRRLWPVFVAHSIMDLLAFMSLR